ncbi:hypothetical protein B0J14DRAFT_656012 [Halenospora varia]|nr:hypothetical protein B0J14DRAFT_656012 [Halenospora varia]
MRYAFTLVSTLTVFGLTSALPIAQGPGGGFISTEIPGSNVNNAFGALGQIVARSASPQNEIGSNAGGNQIQGGTRANNGFDALGQIVAREASPQVNRANNVGNEKRQGWRDPDRAVAITTVPGLNALGQIAAREAAPQGPGGGFISIEIPPASEGCLLGMNCPGDPNYPGKKLAREEKDGWCPNGFCGTELPPPIPADGCLLGLNCPGDAGWNGAPWKKEKRETKPVAQGPGGGFISTEIPGSNVNNAFGALGQIVAKEKRQDVPHPPKWFRSFQWLVPKW